MKKFLALLALITASTYSHASVSVTVNAGDLLTSGSAALPTGSLLLLIASGTDGTFYNSLSANQFVAGDNVILAADSVNNNNGGIDATYNYLTFNIPTGAATGQALAIRWFSGFTLSQYNQALTPGIGTYFGTFAGATTGSPNGGDNWLLPSDGSTGLTLQFVTTSLNTNLGLGLSDAKPNSAGLASSQIPVPEPSTYALLGTGLAGLLAARKRRSR